ncbi:MAG: TldD/PmbA family protein [Canidatus Methanoxibalbensis ujae]|nr:TldD/PmbA family protein [Candidatus Methanoxibalbensis ujae]
MIEDIASLMESVLKSAESRCDEVEFYCESAVGLSIEIERWNVKNVKKMSSCGVGVRVAEAKRTGFSYTTQISRRALERCVEEALKRARSSEEDADFSGFPTASSYKTPVGTYDRDIVEMCDDVNENTIAEAIERCEEMLDGVRAYKNCRPTDGGFSAAYDTIFVMNSHGVCVSDTGTFASAGITVVSRDDVRGEEVSGSEGEARRALRDMNFRWIGEEASRTASESLGGEKAETRETSVILSPRAVQSILAYTTIPHLSAENVQRNRSPYRGKTGEQIASEITTIIDDGTAPGRLNTRKMDGEGVHSQRTVVVEKGILKSFLYDSYTASKDGVESTGNAVRGYDHTPVIGATNLCIESNTIATKDELLRDVRDGIFVNDVILTRHLRHQVTWRRTYEKRRTQALERRIVGNSVLRLEAGGTVR